MNALVFTVILAFSSFGADGIRVFHTKVGEDFREVPAATPSAYACEGARLIDLDTAKERWGFLGLGTAFTEASCRLIRSLPEPERTALVRRLFGPDGLNLSVGRITCGSSDYSMGFYTYDDGPADPTLKRFSIDRDRADVLPVIKAAQAVNPDLYFLSSTWSPPGWMKDNGTIAGGTLDMKYADVYADYLIRFFKAYAEEGVVIRAFTAQNEPDAAQQYNSPTCVLSGEQEATVIKATVAKAKAAGLDVKPWLYDLNFCGTGRVERCLQDADLRAQLGGVAWHAYAGEPEMIRPLRERYPTLPMYMTEFCPMYDVRKQNVAWWGNLILRTLNSGCSTFVNWCPVLDEDGEPNVSLGFPVWGLVTLDSRTHEVRESEMYRAFRHLSPYVRPGAKLLEAPIVARPKLDPKLRKLDQLVSSAFRNPDGSTVVVIVGRNDSEHAKPYHKVQVQIRLRGRYLPVQVHINAITTVVFPPPPPPVSVFEQADWCSWCPSPVALSDGRTALAFSRWPESAGFRAWSTQSEIALAVSEKGPLGPYSFVGPILKGSGREGDFDRDVTHNPCLFADGGKFYLYYMGTSSGTHADRAVGGAGHRHCLDHQLVGVAVADKIEGPYRRTGRPLLKAEPGVGMSNPAICRRPDGRYLLLVKWWTRATDGGDDRVAILAALGETPLGPFEVVNRDCFPVEGVRFPGEDPCLWVEGDTICCAIHDMARHYSSEIAALIRFESRDGLAWTNKGVLVPRGSIARLERPFVHCGRAGERILFAASKPKANDAHSLIVAYPRTPRSDGALAVAHDAVDRAVFPLTRSTESLPPLTRHPAASE